MFIFQVNTAGGVSFVAGDEMCLLRLSFGLLVLSAAPVLAASFPCSKATTPQERAICSDSKLSELDEQVAVAYKELRAQLSPEGARKILDDQRRWLTWMRLICPDSAANKQAPEMTPCLTSRYTERLQLLTKGPRRIEGIVFFPRLTVLTIPDDPPEPASIDPGFGVGSFAWPEIDRPTPQQEVWNRAIRHQVVQMSVEYNETGKVLQDFSAQSIAGSDVRVDYALKSANDKFISVDLENGTYDYGAAHPNEYTVSFLWLLDRQREVKPDDVFRTDSEWKQFLVKRSLGKLQNSEKSGELFDSAEILGVIEPVVENPKNWNLDSYGFEIDFPEYSVAPRVAGMISATLRWTELQPYLANGFNPNELPKPLAK
jgi:uncharacterized protein